MKLTLTINVATLKEVVGFLGKSTSRDPSHVSSHFVVKKLKGKTLLEGSSFNGNAFCSVTFNGGTYDSELEFGFTLDAKRFSEALGLLKVGEDVKFTLDDVTSYTPKVLMVTRLGKIKFQSMNWDAVPKWTSFSTGNTRVIAQNVLKDCFAFCANFCKDLPQSPSISIIDCAGGKVRSTDGQIVSEASSPDISSELRLKLHIKNYGMVKNSLSYVPKDVKVHLYPDHDSISLFSFNVEEGTKEGLFSFLFGETKSHHSFPDVQNRDEQVCDGYLSFQKSDLLSALAFINCGAATATSGNTHFVELSAADSVLKVHMASAVDEDPAQGSIELTENRDCENNAIPKASFSKCFIPYSDFVGLLKCLKLESIVALIYQSDRHICFVFSENLGGIKYEATVGGFLT